MNDLIKIKFDETSDTMPTISGRELHQALEVTTPYRIWFPRMCEYGFSESKDYTPYIFVHPQNKQETTDHNLSLDMAKELCMIQRSPKGKQCREYFLEVERRWNSPEAVMARALRFANNKLLEATQTITVLENKVQEQQADIDRMKPKEIFADSVAASDDTILIRDLAKLLKQNGVKTGEKRLYAWMRDNGYIIKGTTSPTQRAMNLGLFVIKESTRILPTGQVKIDPVTRVTGKGQQYFLNKGLKLKVMDGER